MLIHNKDDIEFVTEFPCFLGHPVQKFWPLILFKIWPKRLSGCINCLVYIRLVSLLNLTDYLNQAKFKEN